MLIRYPQNLEYLIALSPHNKKTFTAINHSTLALSLDDYTYTRNPGAVLLNVDSPSEVDDHLHNLRSSHPDRPARNRWWDKPLTLIVESNSRAGAIGEHSPCDALIPSIVAEYAVVQGIDDDAFDGSLGNNFEVSSSDTAQNGWRRLDWVTDKHIEKEVAEAVQRAKVLVDDSDDSVLWFTEYGAQWIKDIGK